MRRHGLIYGAVSALGAGALVWVLLPATQAVAQLDNNACEVLVAGQHYTAGEVCVTQTGTSTISVTFTTTTPWVMTSVHLAVATSLKGIPQANGNPIPGRFPYSYTTTGTFTTYTFTVGTLTPGGTYDIAAHAVVWNKTSEQTVTAVSSTTTQITGASTGSYSSATGAGSTSGTAALADQPTNYPQCTFTTTLGGTSVWNSGIGSTWSKAFTAAGANWIWNTAGTIPTGREITGQVVTFVQTVDVPGLPVSGTLDITADNAYRAYLNGTEVGQARVGTGFPTTLMAQPTGAAAPQTGTWGVASQGWQSVGSYAFTPTMGQNMLRVQAANEYMSGGTTYTGTWYPADHYLGWNGSTYTSAVYNDPTPNVTTNHCYNPGGAIFMATASYYSQTETAWGAGTPFPGRNWATYFTYTLEQVG